MPYFLEIMHAIPPGKLPGCYISYTIFDTTYKISDTLCKICRILVPMHGKSVRILIMHSCMYILLQEHLIFGLVYTFYTIVEPFQIAIYLEWLRYSISTMVPQLRIAFSNRISTGYIQLSEK